VARDAIGGPKELVKNLYSGVLPTSGRVKGHRRVPTQALCFGYVIVTPPSTTIVWPVM
jgi:hypothetical protein